MKNGKHQQVDPGINTPCDCENPKFIIIHGPAGLVGNPHATPQCTVAQFASSSCPVDSQVGVVEVGFSTTPTDNVPIVEPTLQPGPAGGRGGPARLPLGGVPIFQVFSARTGSDYGLDTKVINYNGLPTGYANEILWGVPAHPSHDPLRFDLGAPEAALRSFCDVNGILASPGVSAPTGGPTGPASSVGLCGGALAGVGALLQQPADALHPEPDDLRSGAGGLGRRPLL